MKSALKIISHIKIIFLLVVLFILSSCMSKQEKQIQVQIPSYKISHVVIDKDTSESYIIYIPEQYEKRDQHPVIFAFDPHGDGKLAVNKILEGKGSAEYIIVGSNNSKNGLKTLDYTLDLLLSEVLNKFKVDSKRLYAVGFSGGGRVASYMALKYGNIKGVMTCGAGINNLNSYPDVKRFNIYAVAGKGDFNYKEVQEMKNNVNNAGWTCMISEFNGGHEWPPAQIISEALLFFKIENLKNSLLYKRNDFINTCIDSIYNVCQLYYSKNECLNAANECDKAIILFKGLKNVRQFGKLKREIFNDENYKEQLNRRNEILKREENINAIYFENIYTKDTVWWKNEVLLLNKNIVAETNPEYAFMYSRIKAYLGILCYSVASRSIAEKNLETAKKCIPVYEIVEPDNLECKKLKSVLQEMTDDKLSNQ
jgi:dienelactone hydrolase